MRKIETKSEMFEMKNSKDVSIREDLMNRKPKLISAKKRYESEKLVKEIPTRRQEHLAVKTKIMIKAL